MSEEDLVTIQLAISEGAYQYSLHAVRRMTERKISRVEIETAISQAELIENYPDDKYGPSCLLLGITPHGKILHIQVSCPPSPIKIITLYEPNPDEWENNRTRKSP